jgi:hypothetical protein
MLYDDLLRLSVDKDFDVSFLYRFTVIVNDRA